MFARVFCIAILVLPAFAARGISIGQCTDPAALECCDTIKDSSDLEVITALNSLGIPLPNPAVPFGLNCTAHGYPGLGGDPCGDQVAACCFDNGYPGNVSGRCSEVDFSQK